MAPFSLLALDPPFFQTTWLAWVVAGAAILALAAYRWRVRGLAARNRELEQLVEIRTRQLEEANEFLGSLATKDGLTGVANHRIFHETLAEEWERARRSGEPLSVLFVDIDQFRELNDDLGHRAGDECLVRIAAILEEEVSRAADLVARYGGEEFVLLLPGTGRDGALNKARRIRSAVRELGISHPSSERRVMTASIGLATTVPGTEGAPASPAELIEAADRALRRAKEEGRDRMVASWQESGGEQSPENPLPA